MSHSDEKKLDIIFNPRRFENAYVDIPNPFEAGDIVRLTTDGGQGIVMTSQKEWKEYNEKMKATNCADFSDVNIIVDLLLEDGHIVHNHINPIFLEKYDPTEDEIDYDLLRAGSGIYTGRCGLDWFTECYDSYKKKCQYMKGVIGNGKNNKSLCKT